MSALVVSPTRLLDRLPRVEVGRMPTLGTRGFTLLVMGIFASSLVGSLFINVALTQGAFQEAELTHDVRTIEAQQQAAQQTLAMLGSPGVLESRARAMGMVPAAAPVFLRLTDGKVFGQPIAAERIDASEMLESLMPLPTFLDPELPMAAAARKTTPVRPRSDAAVEITESAP